MIPFTAEWSKESVVFLNTSIIREGDKLITDLYLHRWSCHPSHCENSITYSQALRLWPGAFFFFSLETALDTSLAVKGPSNKYSSFISDCDCSILIFSLRLAPSKVSPNLDSVSFPKCSAQICNSLLGSFTMILINYMYQLWAPSLPPLHCCEPPAILCYKQLAPLLMSLTFSSGSTPLHSLPHSSPQSRLLIKERSLSWAACRLPGHLCLLTLCTKTT